MSARRAASQLLNTRSVHLRIVPRPANLSESREIYRVLQRFGEISTYKSLKYEYHNPAENSAIVIYRNANDAQKALDATPIRFALEKVTEEIDENDETLREEDEDNELTKVNATPTALGIEEILSPPTLSTRTEPTANPLSSKKSPQPSMPFDPPPPISNTAKPRTRTKWFQVTVDRSHSPHQDHVERQPYWKQFSPTKSLAQEDLAKKVPYIGLSDVSKRPPGQHRTPNKVLQSMNDYLETKMPSLRAMAENDEQEQRFLERIGAAEKETR